jgi:hypothetical protein
MRFRRWLAAAVMILLVGWAGVVMVDRFHVPGSGPAISRCPRETNVLPQPVGGMTPYAVPAGAEQVIQGATLDLSQFGDLATELPVRLRSMREQYRINTVAVYGLDRLDAPGTNVGKDVLFAELTSLDMKIVVRLEAYDPQTFAFMPADLDQVLGWYAPLIRYLSDPARSARVEYFALNMPVDDPAVQDRLGGINSDLSKRRQVEYATAFVARTRAALAESVAGSVKLYLSVFYGWDNSYDTPAYSPAQPDGYFLTNYSYPGATIRDENATDSDLINMPRLTRAMDRFNRQYPGSQPVVVEYGFQTLDYQHGAVPSQTAGLVKNMAAKRRALLATTRFYCDNYPRVQGTVYFGYNVYKKEGVPPATLDFALDYSVVPGHGTDNGATFGRRTRTRRE